MTSLEPSAQKSDKVETSEERVVRAVKENDASAINQFREDFYSKPAKEQEESVQRLHKAAELDRRVAGAASGDSRNLDGVYVRAVASGNKLADLDLTRVKFDSPDPKFPKSPPRAKEIIHHDLYTSEHGAHIDNDQAMQAVAQPWIESYEVLRQGILQDLSSSRPSLEEQSQYKQNTKSYLRESNNRAHELTQEHLQNTSLDYSAQDQIKARLALSTIWSSAPTAGFFGDSSVKDLFPANSDRINQAEGQLRMKQIPAELLVEVNKSLQKLKQKPY